MPDLRLVTHMLHCNGLKLRQEFLTQQRQVCIMHTHRFTFLQNHLCGNLGRHLKRNLITNSLIENWCKN